MENKITWEDLKKVNAEIKTTKLPAKKKNEYGQWVEVTNDYVEVKERVIAFRKLFPMGLISTEVEYTNDYVQCTAKIYKNVPIANEMLAVGHAREPLNKGFALENAETSAIGRALGFCGLGIDTSIASAEEINNLDSPSGIFDEPIPTQNVKELADEFRSLYSMEEQARILNGLKLKRAEDIGIVDLQKYVNFKKYGKK